MSIKKKTESVDEEKRNKRLGGLYGTTALAFYAIRICKETDDGQKKPSTFYMKGGQRAFDIDRIRGSDRSSKRTLLTSSELKSDGGINILHRFLAYTFYFVTHSVTDSSAETKNR